MHEVHPVGTSRKHGNPRPQCGMLEPHVGQNTNATIESYYSNFKSIMNFAKKRFVGMQMDWLIYHMTSDVVTYYWYFIQCKAFGFIRNRKQEGIVVLLIKLTNTIPDINILICMDEDVTYFDFVNNTPKM